MKVDVVVCVKNQAKCLERILRQIDASIPYENLIVIYATSADETEKIAKTYTNNVFWDEDTGLGAARNLGVRKATSEIVAMIDADVILTESWYQQLIEHFQIPSVAAVMGTCIYGYGYKPLESYWEYLRRTPHVNYGCQNTMFKREIVLKVGNFDQSIRGAGEDYDLYLRLLAAGYEWVWERKATVYHPMSMSEYLKHVRWWEQGRPYVDEMARERISLLRFYGRQVLSILQAFCMGAKLSVFVHPTLLIYFPIMGATSAFEKLKELKKDARTRYDREKNSRR